MPCRAGGSVPLGRDEALLHVAYKPFTGRLHSPGEYLLYGCDASGRGVPESSAEPTRGRDGRSAGRYRYRRVAGTRGIPAGGSVSTQRAEADAGNGRDDVMAFPGHPAGTPGTCSAGTASSREGERWESTYAQATSTCGS